MPFPSGLAFFGVGTMKAFSDESREPRLPRPFAVRGVVAPLAPLAFAFAAGLAEVVPSRSPKRGISRWREGEAPPPWRYGEDGWLCREAKFRPEAPPAMAAAMSENASFERPVSCCESAAKEERDRGENRQKKGSERRKKGGVVAPEAGKNKWHAPSALSGSVNCRSLTEDHWTS